MTQTLSACKNFFGAHNVFDSLNNALTTYVKISGDGSVSKDEIERAYQAVLTTTEQARRAIAGAAYDTPSFRGRAARFVMDTAASEYADSNRRWTPSCPGAGRAG